METMQRECQRCGYKWIPRKFGRPNNCANKKCYSTAWDTVRPHFIRRETTGSRLFPELHALEVGKSCDLKLDIKDFTVGDPRPIRAVNYESKKYGKKFYTTPRVGWLRVTRTA